LLKYRPDIDGLRAIAVLLVIFCHAELSFFSGGYIGVDIFFVISGYLITRLILEALATNQFSFAEFYLKRACRILPALGVMVLATACLDYLLAMPQHLDSLSGALFSVCFFVPNIFFQYESADYFGQTTLAFQPLLHTWSLGVEEQFYFVFPILLVALWRFGNISDWLARIGTVSLIVSLLLIASSPAWAFYSLPSRFWELLMGGYLAAVLAAEDHSKKLQLSTVTSSILSTIGIALIAASTVFYSVKTPFPGLAALSPCVGTALLIWTGTVRPTLLHRILGSAPFRTVGALSYSLFLWHWPIRVYCLSPVLYYYFSRHFGLVEQFALTAGISWLSWKYVETPMRALTLSPFHPAAGTCQRSAVDVGNCRFGVCI
jgi:peptidoglycan/LPS O-acetylase OafA/YrhL